MVDRRISREPGREHAVAEVTPKEVTPALLMPVAPVNTGCVARRDTPAVGAAHKSRPS